ncbi:transglutaminase domain-containing protein [Stackebrandtia sp.]|jgi:hypothetical protein|uniref:transglutaminase domain-containing protein n=1 Tax=Stackebrandtia sp. TaxID=2023065 RepID=UPI002D77773D|nr:transglutaminase domain-containing protein [Stackebrandtia sp.]
MDTDMYRALTRYTDPGRHSALLDNLPDDVAGLVEVVQGLLIHEFLVETYGDALTEERRATVHLRPVEAMLGAIVAADPAPLATARPPRRRLVINCRHYTVLAVTLLRAKGIAARARCGFGGYFGPGVFEDHWVCEYLDPGTGRWRLLDAELDATQRDNFGIDFDPLDVPRDRFLVAGDAWRACRQGRADPKVFGLSAINEAGYWWIAGNLVRDVAALNNVESLPWDCWGPMPNPHADMDDKANALFDGLAALTVVPGPEVVRRYRGDTELRVPSTIYNANLDKDEDI